MNNWVKAVLPKSVTLGKKHGKCFFFTKEKKKKKNHGKPTDSELKDRDGKEVKHGIFQSIARKGCVRKDCLT